MFRPFLSRFLLLSGVLGIWIFSSGVSPAPDSDEINILETANNAFNKGDFDAAIAQINDFLTRFSNSTQKDRAYFLLGESLVRKNHLPEARDAYKQIVDQFQTSPLYSQAYTQLAYLSYDTGQWGQAQVLLEELAGQNTDPLKFVEIYDRLFEISSKKSEWVKGVHYLLEKLKYLSNPLEQQQASVKILALIQTKMTKKELVDLAEKYPQKFPGDAAGLQLMTLYENEKDTFHLERTIKHFMDLFPKNENVEGLRQKLNLIREKTKKHKYLVGVLIPSSKKLEKISDQVINGINLALWDYERATHDDSIGLVFKELGGQSAKNISDTEAFIKEYSPRAMVGPLLSKEFESMSGLADNYSLPFITPAGTHPGITARSKFLLRDALTNSVQAREIADYAMTQAGLKRFVILYPKNAYGEELSKSFAGEVARLGGEVIDSEAYSPETTDFSPQIKHLIKVDLSKYGVEGDKIEGKDTKNRVRREYAPGFDAVYLPGEGVTAGLIPSQLAFYEIMGVKLLGSNGWNSPDFIEAGGKFVEGGIFADGFFMESPLPLISSFVDRYRKAFQQDPTLFSAQSYDSMEVIIQAIKTGATSGIQIKNAIFGMNNYEGISGATHFKPDGEAEKKVFIIEIKNGRFKQLN